MRLQYKTVNILEMYAETIAEKFLGKDCRARRKTTQAENTFAAPHQTTTSLIDGQNGGGQIRIAKKMNGFLLSVQEAVVGSIPD